MKKIYLLAVFFILKTIAFSQTTFFTYGTTWKYKDDGSNQGTAWRASAFDDSGWASGPGQLGFGDGDEGTVINACGTVTQFPSCTNKYIGYYFRKTINIPNVNLFQNFKFNMYRDDGVVIYINGTEVYRNNMPTGTISYNTAAPAACSDDGLTIQTTTLSVAASLLVSGNNTIAVEVHQNAGTSSDLTWDLELIGMPLPVGGALITRGPYLQKASSTGITFRWRTDNAVNGKVRYGTDSLNLNDSVVVAGAVTEHTVAVTGLTPYTKYYYNIGSSSGVMQGSVQNYFVTSPVPGTEGKYTFWVAGDCGNNSTNQANVRDRYNTYIGNNTTNGWLLLGDNAYTNGTDAEFTAEFFNIYQSNIMKHAPLWPVPGNHDYDNGSAARQNDHAVPYYAMFDVPTAGESGGVASGTEAYYSYDYGNIHFLALDSYGKENNATRLYDTLGAQVQWIKADLAANNKKWVIAYWHHPPFTMGSHNSDTEAELVSMRTNFIRILERLGVDLIMCGHSHDYERSKLMKGHYGNEASFNPALHNLSQSTGVYDGTTNSCTYLKDTLHNTLQGTVYVVAGSAGQLDGTGIQASFPHAAMQYSNATNGGSFVLQIEGNRLDAKWLCADGVIRDKFTIIKDASKVKTYTIDLGDSLNLSASWNGQYSWPHSGETTRAVRVVPSASTVYVATDQYQCVADTFKVLVNIPVISAATPTVTNFCAGSTVNLPFNATGRFSAGNIFTAQLSDASGSFASPTTIGTISATGSSAISATLPAGLTAGSNYRIRIISSIPAINGTVTGSLLIDQGIPAVALTSSDADNSICQGTAVTFTSSGAHTYEFLVNGISQGAPTATAIFNTSALMNGDIVISKGYNACGNNTNSITTAVTGIPTVAVSSSDADNSICAGSAITFTGTGANTYEFFVNGISQGAPSAVTTFNTSALADGQSVTVKGDNGCFQNTSSAISTTVISAPVVSLASSDADNSVCQGAAVTFTGTGASTYEFLVNGVSQGAASAVNTFNISSLTDGQFVEVKGYNQCFNTLSSSITTTVIGTPSVSLASSDADNSICQGTAVTFTGSGGNTYEFFVNGISQGAASTVTTFNTSSLTTGQSVTVKGYNQCFNNTSSSVVTTVTGTPVVSMTSSDADNSICAGSAITFTGSGGNTYEFFVNGISQGAPGAVNTFNTSALTDGQSVTVKGDNGCFQNTSSAISTTVISVPVVTLLSSDADNSICQGSAVTFTGSGANTYEFFVNGISQGAASALATFNTSALADGQSVTVKGDNGCFQNTSSAISTTVVSTPAVTLLSSDADNAICQGTVVTFTGSGGNTYEFFVDGISQGAPTALNTFNTSALASGQSVTVKGYNQCFNSTSSSVVTSVTGAPVVTLTSSDADNSICQGESVTFTGAGAGMYEFYVGGISQGVAGTLNTFNTSALTNGQTIKIKGANECFSDSSSVTFTVNALPAVAVNSSDADNIICAGQDVTFTSSGAQNYEFFVNSISQGAPGTTNFFSSASLINNDAIVVQGTSAQSCQASSTPVTITVNPLPLVTINAAGPTTFCLGDSVTLTATTTETNYLWNTGATTQSINATAAGNYSAAVTSAAGCNGTSSVISVSVNTPPSTPVISQSGNILTSDALTGNQWYFNGSIIPGATSQTYTATTNGMYTVMVTDGNACSSGESAPVNIISTGIASSAKGFNGVSVFPNPFSDQIELNYSLSSSSKISIELMDITGKLIAKIVDLQMADAGEHKQVLKASDYSLQNGMYLVKISTSNGSQIVRINYIP